MSYAPQVPLAPLALYEKATAVVTAQNVFADALHASLYRPRAALLPVQSFGIPGLSSMPRAASSISDAPSAFESSGAAVESKLAREIVFLWSIRVALSEVPDRLGRGQTAKEIDQLDNIEKYLERIGQINANLRSISIDLHDDDPSKDQCIITLRQADVLGVRWTEPLRLEADPSIVALARNDFGRSIMLDHLTGQRAKQPSDIPVWADPAVYVGIPSRRVMSLGAYSSGRASEDMLHVRPCGDHAWIRDVANGCAVAFHDFKQCIGKPSLVRNAQDESSAITAANRAVQHWWEGQLHRLQAQGMRGTEDRLSSHETEQAGEEPSRNDMRQRG